MELAEKIPPNNLEAERAVLGSILLDSEAVTKAIEILSARSFYAPNHQLIFSIVHEIFKKKQPVDLVTVSNLLKDKQLLEESGGYLYLCDLAESVPTTANVGFYCKIVEEKFIRRELIKNCYEIISSVYNKEEEVLQLLDEAEKKIFTLSRGKTSGEYYHIRNLLVENFEVLSEQQSGNNVTKKTISTGIDDLDNILNGGLRGSDLIIIAARPSMGKTALCLNIATNIAIIEKLPVLIFSMEMKKEQITERILSAESGISSYNLNSGIIGKDMWGDLTKTVSRLYNTDIFIDDNCNLTTAEMASRVRKLRAENPKIGAVIIDYLQLIKTDSGRSRNEEVAKISSDLKRMARELDVPVIALSQLSRDVEKRNNKRPMMSDLRDSGSIEQDSDIIMLLYRDEYYNTDSDKKKQAELIIAKHRNGQVGTVNLFFDAKLTKFSGLE